MKRSEMNAADAAKALSAVLRSLLPDGTDLTSEALRGTPGRMYRALHEMTAGYDIDPRAVLGTTFPGEGYDQVVAVTGIPFASLCEHHVLPFTGTVDVAYLPGQRIVGLSKLPRLVECYSRRLQVQERLTRDIAGALHDVLDPRGVMVRIRGQHSCMALRGIRSPGMMTTSDIRGVFRDEDAARSEVFSLFPKD